MATVQTGGHNYLNITTGATTQVVASGQGVLKAIVINKALTGTIKLIDGISGSTANIATITNGTTAPLGTVVYDVSFGNGLRIINSATEDFTVVWRV